MIFSQAVQKERITGRAYLYAEARCSLFIIGRSPSSGRNVSVSPGWYGFAFTKNEKPCKKAKQILFMGSSNTIMILSHTDVITVKEEPFYVV